MTVFRGCGALLVAFAALAAANIAPAAPARVTRTSLSTRASLAKLTMQDLEAVYKLFHSDSLVIGEQPDAAHAEGQTCKLLKNVPSAIVKRGFKKETSAHVAMLHRLSQKLDELADIVDAWDRRAPAYSNLDDQQTLKEQSAKMALGMKIDAEAANTWARGATKAGAFDCSGVFSLSDDAEQLIVSGDEKVAEADIALHALVEGG